MFTSWTRCLCDTALFGQGIALQVLESPARCRVRVPRPPGKAHSSRHGTHRIAARHDARAKLSCRPRIRGAISYSGRDGVDRRRTHPKLTFVRALRADGEE